VLPAAGVLPVSGVPPVAGVLPVEGVPPVEGESPVAGVPPVLGVLPVPVVPPVPGVLPVPGMPPVPFEAGVLLALFAATVLLVSARSPPQPAARLAAKIDMAIARILYFSMPSFQSLKLLFGNCLGGRTRWQL
jgi:hypothetical protein